MKKFIGLGLLLLALALSVSADDSHTRTFKMRTSKAYLLNQCDVEFEEGKLTLEKRGRHGLTMEITEEYELFVDGRQIELDENQQRLVKDTYDQTSKLVKHAKLIGLEGARIGLDGAYLGVKAVGKVFKMMFSSYDEDDLEREIEAEAEEIERRADRLEYKAEKIEALVIELEETFDDLVDQTPELAALK